MKKLLLSVGLGICLLNTTSFAECGYYNDQSIYAKGAKSIGILSGYLYSDATVVVQKFGYSLDLIPVTPEQWEEVWNGNQVVLTGNNRTCHCTVPGDTSQKKIGTRIMPMNMNPSGPISCSDR